MKCSICHTEDIGLYGHNAEPVNSGRCCGECNDIVVIPERIKQITKEYMEDK